MYKTFADYNISAVKRKRRRRGKKLIPVAFHRHRNTGVDDNAVRKSSKLTGHEN